MAEAGVKDMEVEFWQGLVAPAGTPAPIIKKLEDEADGDRAARRRAARSCVTHEIIPVGSTPEDYARVIAKELVQWAEVAKAGNIKIE